jgi:hypothetical protein
MKNPPPELWFFVEGEDTVFYLSPPQSQYGKEKRK